MQDYPLPGPANRFDYQSIDPGAGRLYLNHMNAGRLVVFDLNASRLIAEVSGLPRATGVWAVPAYHKVFVSAAGNHEVAVIDDRTLTVAARIGGIRFPDGIGFAPGVDRVFVSDESGNADVSIDARTNAKRATIVLGGEAGNTHYDSVSRCVLVAVQTRNQLVAIDPVTEKIVARYDLPGSDSPHGFALDEAGRLAFITGEGNARLQVVDLRTMRVLATHSVGAGPDVVAWDSEWRRLYVASESGVVSAFEAVGNGLRPLGEYRAPSAHTVSVDPRTHRVYLPLENVNGHPVLRVLMPSSVEAQPPRAANDSETVVFVCEHGTVKSVVAMTYFTQLARERQLPFRAISRGTTPDSTVPSLVRDGLRTDGLPLGAFTPRLFTGADLGSAIAVISFDQPSVAATVAGRVPTAAWDGMPAVSENYAAARDAIRRRVVDLVDSLARIRRAPSNPPS